MVLTSNYGKLKYILLKLVCHNIKIFAISHLYWWSCDEKHICTDEAVMKNIYNLLTLNVKPNNSTVKSQSSTLHLSHSNTHHMSTSQCGKISKTPPKRTRNEKCRSIISSVVLLLPPAPCPGNTGCVSLWTRKYCLGFQKRTQLEISV